MSAGPGLDLRALQGLRRGRDTAALLRRVEQHLDDHEGYLAFSGGKDSLVVLHLALQVDPEVPVAFFDSGFEYPQTYAYLDQLADRWSLALDVIPARQTSLQLLAASGAWDHRQADASTPSMHQVLITEPAAAAHARYGAGELWGVRAQESRGRAAAYANALRAGCTCDEPCRGTQRRDRHGGTITRTDSTVAYGPVWDWSTDEVWGHISRHRLPVNPVYEHLRRLGAPEHFLRISHVLDANRLEDGLAWLRRGWPSLFDEIATVLPRIREYL